MHWFSFFVHTNHAAINSDIRETSSQALKWLRNSIIAQEKFYKAFSIIKHQIKSMYNFYINAHLFIILIMSIVNNFISYYKNNISVMRYTIAIHRQYESVSVLLVYISFKYIFLYIFTILHAYFFLDGRPRSSSCDFSSSSCTSGTYRTSSCSSLCS